EHAGLTAAELVERWALARMPFTEAVLREVLWLNSHPSASPRRSLKKVSCLGGHFAIPKVSP
ncbi:unnamed protein product, partial [Prorocentrum cordatum]